MQPNVSFAFTVKEEAIGQEFSLDAARAFLSAFSRYSGVLHFGEGRDELDLTTESAAIAKKLYQMVTSLYGLPARFAYTKPAGLRKKVRYHVLFSNYDAMLEDLSVDFFSPKVPVDLVKTPEMASAYLAGAFLSLGSVNDPSSSNYHLEIAFTDESTAKWASHLLNKVQSHQFTSKVAKRRSQYIVYLKRSDQISDFLILIGAPQCCLEFENVRISRDFANIGNRLSILDTANYGKTMKAADRQVKEITFFKETIGLDQITNPKLRLLMDLRLANPEASLDELANMMSEEMAMTVTKSNVNHLFRHIHEEYEKAHPNE